MKKLAHLRREYHSSLREKDSPHPFFLSLSLWFQKAGRIFSVLKREFHTRGLNESLAPSQPRQLFSEWMDDAIEARLLDPNAMTLGTLGPDNRPSLRTVLLKELDGEDFIFFTNYQSRKGQEIRRSPAACLLFYWPALARQVRIEGKVYPISPKQSLEYFQSRPRGSQVGAWASPQSRTISGREFLEERVQFFQKKFRGKSIPKPPHWGGYRLVPDRFEFWSGRPNRLHDRFFYFRKPDGKWKRKRLAP